MSPPTTTPMTFYDIALAPPVTKKCLLPKSLEKPLRPELQKHPLQNNLGTPT
jgi:hypothetical protein